MKRCIQFLFLVEFLNNFLILNRDALPVSILTAPVSGHYSAIDLKLKTKWKSTTELLVPSKSNVS